jgi:hypothetical protein
VSRASPPARPIGINHIAIELGDVDVAFALYELGRWVLAVIHGGEARRESVVPS